MLFQEGKFAALIDFDDANYTYLIFDLVGLIEGEAWHHERDRELAFDRAKKVVDVYSSYRPLNRNEKRHLFDVYQLSILFDCFWFFRRGGPEDFYEKRKIDFLNSVGREAFYNMLFMRTKNG